MELYSALMQSIEQHAERCAFCYLCGDAPDGETVIYRQLGARVNQVGHYLQSRVSETRQHVAMWIPNTLNFPYALFGIFGAGHIALPFNPLLTAEEAVALIDHSETQWLLFDPQLQEKVDQAVRMTKTPVRAIPVPQMLEEEKDTSPLNPQVTPDELAMIMYTSGTTGDPKGVMLTHKNFHANCQSVLSLYRFTPGDTIPCALPLFHSFAMTGVIFCGLLTGSKIVLFPNFVPHKMVDVLTQEDRVILYGVPPMLYLVAHTASEEAAARHNLRYVISGGGPLPVDVAHFFERKMNHPILEGYGLTEAAPVVASNRPGQNKIGTIGPALPGVSVQIRNEQGEALPTGEVGELCLRGDNVMQGYYKNPEATRKTFWESGWLRTGDLARMDADGVIQICGRAKDLIVCGGENIYPREIEEVLMRHPAVKEAAVVGKPNRLRAEVPFAFVVLREGHEAGEAELRKHCRAALAEFKVPEGFEFAESLPKTAKGSIQKGPLKQRLGA